MKWSRVARAGAAASLLLVPFFSLAQDATSTPSTSGGAAADIQREIDEHNDQIAQLNREIASYQKQLDAASSKKQTLQSALVQLNLSIKKATASIAVTKNKIGSTELQIKQLSGNIADTQQSINKEEAGLAESIRRLHELDNESLALLMLTSSGVPAIWDDMNALNALQIAVNEHVDRLSSKKETLTDTKTSAEEKRAQLLQQQKTLQTQQGSLTATKKAQSDLLEQTKSQESAYQAIIVQKQSQEQALEAALGDLQAKYNVTVTQSQITPAGKGILHWPLDTVRVTQYFGNTAFAQSGAYNGKGHNGVDLAAPIGTPVKAALSGTVVGTGNTDLVRGCYSFGKWVMVKHANGLNTMYAHFSQVTVLQGQSVTTGQLLGYSGETGYATGPHLHFGVYVSSATQILKLGAATNQKTPCANAVMPVAPLAGYLNPLNYLSGL